MKTALLAGAAILASVPAYAGLITVSVEDDGVAVALPCVGGLNSPISCTGGSTHFALINIGAAGVPPLSGASLASLTIDATSLGGTHVLDISVDQTGLAFVGGTTATSTFTANHLIKGPFGPTTMSTSVNGVTLDSYTFPDTTTNDTKSFTSVLPALVTSTGHDYSITFTGAGQAATDTIQLITNVPEPFSLAVLGTGLLGLGLVRRRA